MHLLLLAGLLAATIVDLRYYIIPVQIPWALTAAALVLYPVSAALGGLPTALDQANLSITQSIVPIASTPGLGAALGGGIGLVVALVLLWFRFLPRSFDDLEEQQTEGGFPSEQGGQIDPEQMIAHPHPRREAAKELLFLALPAAGLMLGFVLAIRPLDAPDALPLPLAVHVLAGVGLGYLMGGGLVWATRVFGTLAFGKEAMGLGDVHLLAAIGAVLGGFDAVFIFFIAPFVGITIVVVQSLLSAMKKQTPRVIPFGPSLAAATLIMLLFREPILSFFAIGGPA
jgi:leader peptidase (prepilin peptidase)/N-methyltransferase